MIIIIFFYFLTIQKLIYSSYNFTEGEETQEATELPSFLVNVVLHTLPTQSFLRPGSSLINKFLSFSRHWQELGFLIVYVTSRPDFQKIKVMSWLAEHNFPYGLVSFGDGISKDLQKHKTEFLRYLVNDVSN